MRPKPRAVSAARRDARTGADLITWRRERLLRAGFDARLAARIAADCAMDIHALIELVERGCPPDIAARIAAPLDEGRPC
jgi:hypothetical protein